MLINTESSVRTQTSCSPLCNEEVQYKVGTDLKYFTLQNKRLNNGGTGKQSTVLGLILKLK